MLLKVSYLEKHLKLFVIGSPFSNTGRIDICKKQHSEALDGHFWQRAFWNMTAMQWEHLGSGHVVDVPSNVSSPCGVSSLAPRLP